MCIDIADDFLRLRGRHLSWVSVVGLWWKGREDGGNYKAGFGLRKKAGRGCRKEAMAAADM